MGKVEISTNNQAWQQLGTVVEGRVQQVVGQVVQRGHSGSEDYGIKSWSTVKINNSGMTSCYKKKMQQ